MSLDIKNSDNYSEWVEIEFDPNEERVKNEYEPGSMEYNIKQKILNSMNVNSSNNKNIKNIKPQNEDNEIEPGSQNSNQILIKSQDSSFWDEISNHSKSSSQNNKFQLKSPSPVVVDISHTQNEGSSSKLKRNNRSWNSFDVMSLESFNSSNNTKPNTDNNNNNQNRVPFSWAEITKIGNVPDVNRKTQKLKLLTNRNNFDSNNNRVVQNKDNKLSSRKIKEQNRNKPLGVIKENMPPESDPYCTKQDFGRKLKHKRFNKRGNRVKYPNGKRGSNRNSRRKKR